MATETKTFYPGEYDASASTIKSILNATRPVGKGSSNTTYASVNMVTGAGAKTTVFWPFDLSSIPDDAEISSVSCKAKAGFDEITGVKSSSIQLYSGSTAKGSSLSFTNAGGVVKTITAGTWTRNELSNCRLRLYADRSSANSAIQRAIYFYGADLTVTYTYQSEKFMLKLGGSWAGASRVFKKVSGIWVEQTDLANVIEDGVRYQNGGEYVAPAPTTIPVTITGTGNSKYCFATINGTKYASAASGIEVMPGDTIQFTVCGDAHTTYVTINGTKVHTGNPYSMTSYAWTIPDGVFSISIKLYDDGSTAQITVTTK